MFLFIYCGLVLDPECQLHRSTGHGSSRHTEILGLGEVLCLYTRINDQTFFIQHCGIAPLGVHQGIGWQARLVIGLDVTKAYQLRIH